MTDGWRDATHSASFPAIGADRERWIGRLAARQHSLLGLAQLTATGPSESSVRSRLARGRLHRIIKGVYATHPPPYPGITVHRRVVDPRDARRVDGIACVSADLVLIELAPVLDEAELEVILVAAESKGLLKRRRLGELIEESRGRPGIGERAAADRERDQLLALAGWRCRRFVRDRLVSDREGSARRLRELAAARRAELATAQA